jgi:Flp pilus assembly protein TadG
MRRLPLRGPDNEKSMPFAYWQGGWNRRFRSPDKELVADLTEIIRRGGQVRCLWKGAAFGMLKHLATWPRRCARHLSRFCRARQAATAVEFALIAPAFLATLIAIIQTAVVLFAQQTLQTAAMEAGRLFLTGQAQNNGWTASQLISQICPMVQPLLNCSSLKVNVTSSSSFSSASTSLPALTFSGSGISNTFSYTPGTPGQVMVVQLIYAWSTVDGPLGFTLANLPNGMTEIVGVSAFRVEPY